MKILSRQFQTGILTSVALLFLGYALYDSFYLRHLKMPGGMLTSTVFHNHGHYAGWVWAVKPECKRSDRIRVEMAHAAAGPEGSFRIVAYADTAGDGLPDTEIARSELLSAEKPGQWSTFEFTTAEKAIFVGNAWPGAEYIAIYRKAGDWPDKNSPFSSEFYHRLPPGRPNAVRHVFTNMRISFPE